ncbi:hypothetical protein M1N85_01585 [Dehalococcoidia bacterium]|nr:hypothetical protein [Dehalococcoidia bacterium]
MAEMFNLFQKGKERTNPHKESIVVDTLAGGPTVFSQHMLKGLDELIRRMLQQRQSWMKWIAWAFKRYPKVG